MIADSTIGCLGIWAIAGLGNLGYEISAINVQNLGPIPCIYFRTGLGPAGKKINVIVNIPTFYFYFE
jgi:hypothetical protein